MESIGHTHTHSGRNFHSYGTTIPPCVYVRRASKQETSMCALHCKTLSIQNTLLLRCYSQRPASECEPCTRSHGELGRTVVGGRTAGLTPPRPPDAAHRGSAWRPGKAFHASGSEGQRGSPLNALKKQTVAGHSTPAARRCVATDGAVQGSQWTPVGRQTGLGPPHCRYPQPHNATGSLLQLLELHIRHIALPSAGCRPIGERRRICKHLGNQRPQF